MVQVQRMKILREIHMHEWIVAEERLDLMYHYSIAYLVFL